MRVVEWRIKRAKKRIVKQKVLDLIAKKIQQELYEAAIRQSQITTFKGIMKYVDD